MTKDDMRNLSPQQIEQIVDFERSTPGLTTLYLMDAPVHMTFETARSSFSLPSAFAGDYQAIEASKPRGVEAVDLDLAYDRTGGIFQIDTAKVTFDNGWSVTHGEPHLQTGQDDIFYHRRISSADKKTTARRIVPVRRIFSFLDDRGLPLVLFDEHGQPAYDEAHPDGLEALLPTIHAAQKRSIRTSKSVDLSSLQKLVVTESIQEEDPYGMRQSERDDNLLGPFGIPHIGPRPPVEEGLGSVGKRKNFTQSKQLAIRLVNYAQERTQSYEAILTRNSPFEKLKLQGLYGRRVTNLTKQVIEDAPLQRLAFDSTLLGNIAIALRQAAF